MGDSAIRPTALNLAPKLSNPPRGPKSELMGRWLPRKVYRGKNEQQSEDVQKKETSEKGPDA